MDGVPLKDLQLHSWRKQVPLDLGSQIVRAFLRAVGTVVFGEEREGRGGRGGLGGFLYENL